MKRLLCLVFFLVTVHAESAFAHRASDAFLRIKVAGGLVTGQLDLALKDLEWEIGLDENEDQKISWGEVRKKSEAIRQLVVGGFEISVGPTVCPIHFTDFLIAKHSDGAYAALQFQTICPGADDDGLNLKYGLFFERDADHRALLNFVTEDGAQSSDVFSPVRQNIFPHLHHGVNRGFFGSFIFFVQEGLGHIWSGYDHMLFLLSLLLPSVLVRKKGQWEPIPSGWEAALNALKLVTAFTVAHATSLTLISFGVWYPPPSRLVESSIALTILFTAFNNIKPYWRADRWTISLAFGFIHGLGFATALKDLGLETYALAIALLGFNIGVDLAQIAVSAVFLTVALQLRRYVDFYRRYILYGGSFACCLLALLWFIERAFNISIVGF